MFGIDTIKIAYEVAQSQINLVGWHRADLTLIQGEAEQRLESAYRWGWRAPNFSWIRFLYVPIDYRGRNRDHLFLEFSLPKLLFGVNYCNITDWPSAFDQANQILASIPGLPHLCDIQDATLYRLDLCANHYVGYSNISDYLEVISRCYFPHRQTIHYPGKTVRFNSEEINSLYYNKGKQCGDQATTDILRQEIQMRSRSVIGDWIGDREPSLRQITPPMMAARLSKDLNILHLNRPMFCTGLFPAGVLSQKFGARRARGMLGYLVQKSGSMREQMLEKGYTRATISYYERLFEKAGISSNLVQATKALPALQVYYDQGYEYFDKALSDTTTLDYLQIT